MPGGGMLCLSANVLKSKLQGSIGTRPPGPSGERIRRVRDVGGIACNSAGRTCPMPIYLLDLIIVLFALAASVLWFRASRRRVRRVGKHEVFDRADYNRLVTALNRTQPLNAQAALATGIATGLAAIRLVLMEIVT